MSNEIKPVCVLQGPVASRSGYGDHAREVAVALIKWGKFDVKIAPTRWGACPLTELDDETRPFVKEIKSRILTTQLTAQPELFVQVAIPNEFITPAKFNVGVTAGIETTIPRAEWIEGVNRMNLNIVPSKFSKDVFVSAKFQRQNPDGSTAPVAMNRPMEVVFESVNTDDFKKTDVIDADIETCLSSIPEPFCFLFVGHWLQGDLGADRKDVGMLIKVFCEVFKNRKDKPALILKSSGATFSQMDKHELLGKINRIRSSISGDLPNVYLIHGELTPAQMNSLYNHPKVKAHVSFTHGEGFGRPLLEATLSGKPVIATDWSGHLDFLPKDLAVLVPGSLTQVPQSAVNDWIIKESSWFTANYSLAAKKLDEVFTDYNKFLPNAQKLAEQNSKKFTLEAANDAFIKTLEKYLPVFEKKVAFQLPKFKKV